MFKQDNVDVLSPVVGPTDTPAMVNAYGPMEGHKTAPVFVAHNELEKLRDGPLWIADEITETVTSVERARFQADMARELIRDRYEPSAA